MKSTKISEMKLSELNKSISVQVKQIFNNRGDEIRAGTLIFINDLPAEVPFKHAELFAKNKIAIQHVVEDKKIVQNTGTVKQKQAELENANKKVGYNTKVDLDVNIEGKKAAFENAKNKKVEHTNKPIDLNVKVEDKKQEFFNNVQKDKEVVKTEVVTGADLSVAKKQEVFEQKVENTIPEMLEQEPQNKKEEVIAENKVEVTKKKPEVSEAKQQALVSLKNGFVAVGTELINKFSGKFKALEKFLGTTGQKFENAKGLFEEKLDVSTYKQKVIELYSEMGHDKDNKDFLAALKVEMDLAKLYHKQTFYFTKNCIENLTKDYVNGNQKFFKEQNIEIDFAKSHYEKSLLIESQKYMTLMAEGFIKNYISKGTIQEVQKEMSEDFIPANKSEITELEQISENITNVFQQIVEQPLNKKEEMIQEKDPEIFQKTKKMIIDVFSEKFFNSFATWLKKTGLHAKKPHEITDKEDQDFEQLLLKGLEIVEKNCNGKNVVNTFYGQSKEAIEHTAADVMGSIFHEQNQQ